MNNVLVSIDSLAFFAEDARAFCAWCEGPAFGSEPEIQAASWLCKLYGAALTLPNMGCDNASEVSELPPEDLRRAQANLACFNGNYYREYSDPDPMLDDEAGMGDIGDDLLDIYKDVRAGLLAYDLGNMTEAIWHWAFMHRIHWGRHAVGAIFALHCLAISKQELVLRDDGMWNKQ